MDFQYIILGFILAACIMYAANIVYRTWRNARKCKDFHCAGCAFYEKCKENNKKVGKKFGGTK